MGIKECRKEAIVENEIDSITGEVKYTKIFGYKCYSYDFPQYRVWNQDNDCKYYKLSFLKIFSKVSSDKKYCKNCKYWGNDPIAGDCY